MAFETGDRARIVKHLQLHKDQAKADSFLAQLMTEAESFDTTNTTTYVADIQTALTGIETLDTTIASKVEEDAIQRFEEVRVYEVEYVGGGGATAHLKNERKSHTENIWRLLDPDGYLRQFSSEGRVIRTL